MPLTRYIQLPALEGWNLKFQFWARDVTIRRSMTSSIWVNISKMINSKEAMVTDDTGDPVAQEAVLDSATEQQHGGCHQMGGGNRRGLSATSPSAVSASQRGDPLWQADSERVSIDYFIALNLLAPCDCISFSLLFWQELRCFTTNYKLWVQSPVQNYLII